MYNFENGIQILTLLFIGIHLKKIAWLEENPTR
jgi:hypothetical protein